MGKVGWVPNPPKKEIIFLFCLICVFHRLPFSRWIGLVGTPLLLSLILILESDSPPARCAYVVRSLLWSDFKIYSSSSWFLWWQSTGPWNYFPSLSPPFSLLSSSLSLAWQTPTPLLWFTWRLLLQWWKFISCWIVEQTVVHHNVFHRVCRWCTLAAWWSPWPWRRVAFTGGLPSTHWVSR